MWCVIVYVCDGDMLLVSSSLNPVMSAEHRRDQNGNGHLIEKPASLDATPINSYDNPVLEESDMINRALANAYMFNPPNGQCH